MNVRDIALAFLARAPEDWTWADPEEVKALAEFVRDNTDEPWKPGDPEIKDVVSLIEPLDTPFMDMLRRR